MRAAGTTAWRWWAVLGIAASACTLTAPAQQRNGHWSEPRQPAYRSPAPNYRPAPQGYRPAPGGYGPAQGYAPAYAPGYRPESGRMAPRGFYGQQNGYGAAPVERRAPQQGSVPNASVSAAPPLSPPRDTVLPAGSVRGEHLMDWMNAHSSLSPQQQQDALSREPGFHELPGQTQQRIRDRLSELDAMTPQQRQRMLQHTEQMERLNPTQRAEVRGAMLQLGALPGDQKRAVSQAFRELRNVPPDQRAAVANSRFGYFNPQQRYALNRLMQVEPMLPPPERER